MKQVEYITGEADAGQRLDAVLAKHFSDFSRSAWQVSIRKNSTTIDGMPADVSTSIKASQTILATLPEAKAEAGELIAPQTIPEIIYQDDDVIVINKPAGLLTHPAYLSSDEPSVAGAFKDAIDDDEDPVRPGIVHRLDRDTSGVMILARNVAAKKFLQRQFHDRLVDKHYTALVDGNLDQKAARLELPIRKSQKQPNTMVVHQAGRPAITEYKIIREYAGVNLVEIEIFTGRTHQIRAQFAHLGHPVVGDIVYGKKTRPLGLKRQFLHSHKLVITLPSKDKKEFNAPMPRDLTDYLEQLWANCGR